MKTNFAHTWTLSLARPSLLNFFDEIAVFALIWACTARQMCSGSITGMLQTSAQSGVVHHVCSGEPTSYRGRKKLSASLKLEPTSYRGRKMFQLRSLWKQALTNVAGTPLYFRSTSQWVLAWSRIVPALVHSGQWTLPQCHQWQSTVLEEASQSKCS